MNFFRKIILGVAASILVFAFGFFIVNHASIEAWFLVRKIKNDDFSKQVEDVGARIISNDGRLLMGTSFGGIQGGRLVDVSGDVVLSDFVKKYGPISYVDRASEPRRLHIGRSERVSVIIFLSPISSEAGAFMHAVIYRRGDIGVFLLEPSK